MNRQINHKTMRLIVGLNAILIAPVVILLADVDQKLTSISISYWTNAGDIFVGSMMAVAFYLLAYNGTGESKDWEYYLSKAACVFAAGVALFPTKGFTDKDVPPTWTSSVSETFGLTPAIVHNLTAFLLFGCLIGIMWFFSNRALQKGKTQRAYIYRAITILMIAGIAGFSIAGKVMGCDPTMWVEVWGLSLFGAGWILAGVYKDEPSDNS